MKWESEVENAAREELNTLEDTWYDDREKEPPTPLAVFPEKTSLEVDTWLATTERDPENCLLVVLETEAADDMGSLIDFEAGAPLLVELDKKTDIDDLALLLEL